MPTRTQLRSMVHTYMEVTPFILLTTLAEIAAGAFLLDIRGFFELLPGLLFLLPGLMELRGNVATSLAQRLGSAIHIGLVSWDKGYNNILRSNVESSIALSLVVSGVLSVGVYLWSLVVGVLVVNLLTLILLAFLTAALSAVTQAFLAAFVAVYAAYRGLDPDNVTAPVLSVIGDILTIVFLILAVKLVLYLSPIIQLVG
ncbi:MAG: magnesium transporter [Candidatus Bathyarchaeia archaeon]